MQPLAISHYSIVNSLGAGSQAILDALRERRSGLSPCDFETVVLDTYIGRVPGLEQTRIRPDLVDFDCRNNRLAQLGLELDGFAGAVAAARERHGAARIGVFMGTSTSGILETELAFRHRDPRTGALPEDYRYTNTHNTYSLAEFVRCYLELTGPAFVVSSACSSTAKAFGNASRMIAAGICDAAVVGGVDTLCLTTLHGFCSLELTSRGPCRPFDAERDGISIGEGAGYALLDRAGLAPADIDYINFHGTATRSNDAAEDLAVRELFGTGTPCSSTKGATGHLLGAAGITEAIISLLAIEHDLMPGSANTRAVDPELKSHYLLESREARVRRVLSNSFGFGGSNCSLVLGAAG